MDIQYKHIIREYMYVYSGECVDHLDWVWLYEWVPLTTMTWHSPVSHEQTKLFVLNICSLTRLNEYSHSDYIGNSHNISIKCGLWSFQLHKCRIAWTHELCTRIMKCNYIVMCISYDVHVISYHHIILYQMIDWRDQMNNLLIIFISNHK